MNSNKCGIDQMVMDYLNCMEEECRNRMQFIKCHCEEDNHQNGYVKQMMTMNRIEMKNMFG